MKRILIFIAISIMTAFAFTGCQKYDYNPSMGATINGAQYKGNGLSKVHAQVDTSTHTPQLVIITCNSDTYTPGTAVAPSILLIAPHTVGAYTIDTANITVRKTMVYTSTTGTAGTFAVSGTINILSIKDRKIIGNFTLTCADGTTVTNGQYVAEENYY